MMDIALTTVVMAILGTWLGSTEWRMRKMQSDIERKVDMDEIKELIDLKQGTVIVLQKEMREDIHRLYSKMDDILKELHRR